MNDFRLELKEEYKIFVLKEQTLRLERIRFQFDGWGKTSYKVIESYDYQDFKEVILKKEHFKQNIKTEHEFVYTLTIYAKKRGNKKKDKFIFKSLRVESNSNEVANVYVVNHDYFEPFTKALFARLKNYPQVKIYAYETAEVLLLKKINRKIPPLYVGGAVISGTFFLKILTFLLKISLKLSLFYWLDAMIMNIGGVFALFGMSIAYFINQKNKSKAQIETGAEIPIHFFPSYEQEQEKLTQ